MTIDTTNITWALFCPWCGHTSHALSCDTMEMRPACIGARLERCGCREMQVPLCEHRQFMQLCSICIVIARAKELAPAPSLRGSATPVEAQIEGSLGHGLGVYATQTHIEDRRGRAACRPHMGATVLLVRTQYPTCWNCQQLLRHEPTIPTTPEPEQGEARVCTGVTARWCPIHGDCRCDGEDMDSPNCPLHAFASTHAEEPEPAQADTDALKSAVRIALAEVEGAIHHAERGEAADVLHHLPTAIKCLEEIRRAL